MCLHPPFCWRAVCCTYTRQISAKLQLFILHGMFRFVRSWANRTNLVIVHVSLYVVENLCGQINFGFRWWTSVWAPTAILEVSPHARWRMQIYVGTCIGWWGVRTSPKSTQCSTMPILLYSNTTTTAYHEYTYYRVTRAADAYGGTCLGDGCCCACVVVVRPTPPVVNGWIKEQVILFDLYTN